MVKAEKVDADLGDYELLRGPTEKQPVKVSAWACAE